jgi:uroporphyrinogen-III decarboxylase
MSGNKRVFIPLHRGAGGFMNDMQFEKFYWPGLKALLLGLVNAGLTPIPFFEGNYTPRVKFLKELPPGKVVGKFDIMDRKLFKQELADVMCFWGNVPSSTLCTGTPEQVKTDVKELIDLFKDTGGLIIDATNGLPDEAKPDNVQAMTDAVLEYGIY